MIVKHLYKRNSIKNGKTVKLWYFWFYDENKKRIRKSCKTTIKREAEEYIANLKDEDLLKQENPKENFLKECISENFFDENSQWILKQKAKGNEIKKQTRLIKVGILKRILNKYGDCKIEELNSGDIEDWLLSLKLSNSSRNAIIEVFNILFTDLYNHKKLSEKITLEKFKKINLREKGILTKEEIEKLFPSNYEELLKIWKICRTDTDYHAYQFATMIYLMLSTGMRNGEIRAVLKTNFINENAILLNGMIDVYKQRIDHLKKGDEENPKWRLAILSEKAKAMIERMKQFEEYKNYTGEYLFFYHDSPYTTNYLRNHFRDVLLKNGIDWKKRNLTIHSLRFTYNSMMIRNIPSEDLRLMVGHTTQRMTDYYDKSKVTDHLDGLLENKTVIDSIFK